jgi:hypothetical protein
MAYYRLYRRRRGHICGVEELWAENDADAVRIAEQKLAGQPSDLWCGARRVATFDGALLAPAPAEIRAAG